MNKYVEIFSKVLDIVKDYNFDKNLRCIDPGRYEGEPIETIYFDAQEPDEAFGPYRVYAATLEEKEMFKTDWPIYVIYTREDGLIDGCWGQDAAIDELKEECSEYD